MNVKVYKKKHTKIISYQQLDSKNSTKYKNLVTEQITVGELNFFILIFKDRKNTSQS